jgi:hypothetical protein
MTERIVGALCLIFLGMGASAASDLASYLRSPELAAGWALGAIAFLGVGVVRLLRAY